MARMFLLLLTISYAVNISAVSLIDRGIGNLLNESSHVFEGRATQIDATCSEDGCVQLIRIAVSRYIKGGDSKDDVVMVCGGVPMRLWSEYIVFAEELAPEASGCDLKFQWDGVFERFGSEVFRYMSPGTFRRLKDDEGGIYLGGWIKENDFDCKLEKSKSCPN